MSKRLGFHDGCDEEDKAELRKTAKIKIQESFKSLECKQRTIKMVISCNDPCFGFWYDQILKLYSKNLSRELKMIPWIIQLTTTIFQVSIWNQLDPLLNIFFDPLFWVWYSYSDLYSRFGCGYSRFTKDKPRSI